MDIHDAILSILDTHYPHIESWQRIVWVAWFTNHYKFDLHPDTPQEINDAELWVIVNEALAGDLTRFDAQLNTTMEWWQGKVRAGCLPRITRDSLSYKVLKAMEPK